ncbi:MAG: hypothetical protein FWH00_03015 [Oscillospiraceae bacterium]|nr:hypothetical protein [Oscillospiraceae bacterium]
MRLFWLAILCCLLTVGCGVYTPDADIVLHEEYTFAAVPTPVLQPGIADPAGYSFALAPDAPDPLRSAAMFFCDKVYELSGGKMIIEAVTSANPLRELSRGQAQFAFLSGRQAAGLSGYAAAMHMPFNYRNYMHYTMAANNAELLAILADDLSERHRIIPLAGFYTGSSHFLSNIAYLNPGQRESGETAVLLPGSNAEYGLSLFGYDLTAEPSYDIRFSLLQNGGAVLIEVTSIELATNGSWIDAGFSYIPAMHDVSTQFLFVESGFWESLDDVSAAAVTEAKSCLFPIIDEAYLRRETMVTNLIAENHIIQVSGLPDSFTPAFRNAWRAHHEPDSMANHLTRLIAGI